MRAHQETVIGHLLSPHLSGVFVVLVLYGYLFLFGVRLRVFLFENDAFSILYLFKLRKRLSNIPHALWYRHSGVTPIGKVEFIKVRSLEVINQLCGGPHTRQARLTCIFIKARNLIYQSHLT